MLSVSCACVTFSCASAISLSASGFLSLYLLQPSLSSFSLFEILADASSSFFLASVSFLSTSAFLLLYCAVPLLYSCFAFASFVSAADS
ncbi:MAG: hypothetical protein SOT38_03870 [Oscillospiraceae bacterium]|nr:hypothetical protein [Oscillospiraceae bacterium]